MIGSDGEHIGDIKRILTDSPGNRATHLLISRWLLLKTTKLIPSRWVRNVFEDEVHLVVDAELVENLPEYALQD